MPLEAMLELGHCLSAGGGLRDHVLGSSVFRIHVTSWF